MKRLFFILAAIIASFLFSGNMHAQSSYFDSLDHVAANRVTGVAGVKFGDSKEYVHRVILTKALRFLESNAHAHYYLNVSIDGITYDYAGFYFAEGQGLVAASMACEFKSSRPYDAILLFEKIIKLYRNKYSNVRTIKNLPEDRITECGAITEEYNARPIEISFVKSMISDVDFVYYVKVDYYFDRIPDDVFNNGN